ASPRACCGCRSGWKRARICWLICSMGWIRFEAGFDMRAVTHTLPTSPIKGEVSRGGCDPTVPQTRSDTSPLMGEVRRGWGKALGAILLTLLATPALAQALPYHSDPDAREILPSLTPVPAIRFLTTADFPPFNFRDSTGELIGFNVDLAKRICAEVNVACTIQAWPWEQAANALSDDQGDALIAGLAMNDENGALFDFSATYLALPGRFVTRAPDIGVFDAQRLAGRTVAARRDSAHADFIARYLPAAEAVLFDSEIAALEALRDETVDAVFGDAMRASFWLNENP